MLLPSVQVGNLRCINFQKKVFQKFEYKTVEKEEAEFSPPPGKYDSPVQIEIKHREAYRLTINPRDEGWVSLGEKKYDCKSELAKIKCNIKITSKIKYRFCENTERKRCGDEKEVLYEIVNETP
jgi:hypothetical protein